MTFTNEYNDLEKRVAQAFIDKRKEIVEVDFLNAHTNFEDFDDYSTALEDCPTTFFNNKNGIEVHAYITKIDSEGIHIVESEDNTALGCIEFSEINGLYYQINLLEDIDNHLTKSN